MTHVIFVTTSQLSHDHVTAWRWAQVSLVRVKSDAERGRGICVLMRWQRGEIIPEEQ
jgi:hypothetical protein